MTGWVARVEHHLMVNTRQPNALARTRDHMRHARTVMAARGLLYSVRAADGVDLVALVRDCGCFEPTGGGTWDEAGCDAVWSDLTLTEALGLMLARGMVLP